MSIKPSAEGLSALTWVKSSYSTNDGPNCIEVAWTKSSYSTADGADCVEVAWTKSSYSTNDGPECVEVARIPGTVLVRDSKRPEHARLAVTPAAWNGFVSYATA